MLGDYSVSCVLFVHMFAAASPCSGHTCLCTWLAWQPLAAHGYHLTVTRQPPSPQGAITDCNAAHALDSSRVATLQTRASAKRMLEDYEVSDVLACNGRSSGSLLHALGICYLSLLPTGVIAMKMPSPGSHQRLQRCACGGAT